jgi:hypothetical protein
MWSIGCRNESMTFLEHLWQILLAYVLIDCVCYQWRKLCLSWRRLRRLR